ncbi:3-keto-disaccharide hydrolase [Mucilaginibacter antarcticus]|uniref:3-keto-disaccharide hydrolase n=1 Tax=Mucilaginibacter antarcticus TaxID=1855725 RepID=UPI003633A106
MGPKKKANVRGSGVLYHSVGALGADAGFWMRSQEFQVEEGRCGDYWGCAGGSAEIPVVKKDGNNYFYSPQGNMTAFSDGNAQGRHCKKQGTGNEKPVGEWNTLDLYCHGDTSIHVVNGKVAMVLYHNSQSDKGEFTPLIKGKIQLESEGAELFYREIMVQGIEGLPAALLKE